MVDFKYDVFISYSHKNEEWVFNVLLQKLEDYALKVCVDDRNFDAGKPSIVNMENAVVESRHTLIVLTPDWVNSEWADFESILTQTDDPVGRRQKLIPIMLEACNPPRRIKALTYANFMRPDRLDNAWGQVLRALGKEYNILPSQSNLETSEMVLPSPSDILPAGSYIPSPFNRIFMDREEILKEIAEVLSVNNTTLGATQIAAISGMGGIGKTQLAIEFCCRYGRQYRGVHWINARQNIKAEIANLGKIMRLPHFPENTDEGAEQTLQTWKEQPQRLVILDNLDSSENTDPVKLLREWLPKLAGLHILITSHRQSWPADLGVNVHPLDSLPPAESITLLRKLATRLKNESDDDLTKIADRLGYLSLALYLAGRYFNDSDTLTPVEYLNHLDNADNILEHTSLLDWVEGGNPTNHETNIAATFLFSWKQLEKSTHALARDFFVASGYLAPNVPIPHEFFSKIANEKEEDETIATNKAIRRLKELGLLSEQLSLHPLLAEFARLQAKDHAEYNNLFVTVVEKVKILFIDDFDLRQHMEALAINAEKNENTMSGISLWDRLGSYYQEVGEYPAAISAYEHLIEVKKRNHQNTATLVNELGRIYQKLGEPSEARNYHRRALLLYKEAYGENHQGIAEILLNLAEAQRELGELSEARDHYQRALLLYKEVYEEDHQKVVEIRNNLADVQRELKIV